jgi:hypothetical protein
VNLHRRLLDANSAKPVKPPMARRLLTVARMRTQWQWMMGAALAVMLVGPAVARADGFFFNEGLGPGARIRGEMGDKFDGDGISLRLSLGRRVGRFAVEGVLFGTNLAEQGHAGEAVTPELTALSYGVDFRYYVPFSEHLEGYVKGGLHGTSVILAATASDPNGLADYDGRGYDVGAGLSWFIRPFKSLGNFGSNPLAKLKVGLFADLTMQTVRLNKDNAPSLDGDIRMWTFGFGIGSDL